MAFDQRIYDLFDLYVHGDIDRRAFLERASKLVAGGMTAAMVLDALTPRFAEAQQIAKDDKRIKAESLDYDSPQGSGKMRGYLVKPAAAKGKLPGVLVVHENRGLNPHIEDVARRLALEGFVAFAPDALAPLGGYPATRTRRASCSPSWTRPRPARTSSRGGAADEAPRLHRQDRRGRLLLRRRYRQHAGDPAAQPGRRRALLWQPAQGRGRAQDQGAAAAPVRRER
jgi:hypothetical protein